MKETVLACKTCSGQIFNASFIGSNYLVCECSTCRDQMMFQVRLGSASFVGRIRVDEDAATAPEGEPLYPWLRITTRVVYVAVASAAFVILAIAALRGTPLVR